MKSNAYLVSASLQHIHDSLLSHKGIRQLLFPQTIEEYGQVVVEIQLLDLHLPGQAIRDSSVVHLDRQVSALIEAPELSVGRVGSGAKRGVCEQFGLFVLYSVLGYFCGRQHRLGLGNLLNKFEAY